MTKRTSQTTHDQMVIDVYNHLLSKGYSDVRADLDGLSQPTRIYWEETKKGHIPDLTGNKNGTNCLFEVETEDSISDQHTEDQWNLFSANAKQHDKAFIVVVPKTSEASAQLHLNQLGIQADIWTVG
ncbi:MAG: hypothetical protein KKA79_01220 [Nanoarchaeota archaeon]|nr:hypothetical protein [Nanoarchaeota archaeon]